MRKSANCSRNCAGGDLSPNEKVVTAAVKFRVKAIKFQTESNRFSMDAMTAANG